MDNRTTSLSRLLRNMFLALLVFAPMQLFARLEWPASLTDLTEYARAAPTVFRGRVLSVSRGSGYDSGLAIAKFEVDRWYRRHGTEEAEIYFAPYQDPGMRNGHACIDFQPQGYWIVFATEIDGHLRPYDDCTGALPVSGRIAPAMQEAAMNTQMEADFIAGLEDANQEARLFSIQRLAGLRLASSRPVLHRIIEMGNPAERIWAVYAVFHGGDTSVLASVRQMLARADLEWPARILGSELCLQKAHDASESVELMAIANTAAHPVSRECALSALASIKSHQSLPTFAAHLSDPDPRVRYRALKGMGIMTQETACTLATTPAPTAEMIDRQVRRCVSWWKKVGSRKLLSR